MKHLLASRGRANSARRHHRDRPVQGTGLKLVGPLPAAAQNHLLPGVGRRARRDPDRAAAATALLRFLDSPPARRIFSGVGIEATTP
jgi:hypothetical protein